MNFLFPNKCFRSLIVSVFVLASISGRSELFAQTTPSATSEKSIETVLKGAELIGQGVVSAYSKDGYTLLVLPQSTFNRLFLWYAELVSVPGNDIGPLDLGQTVVRFERHGATVFVRDLTRSLKKRAGQRENLPGQNKTRVINPIGLSVRHANEAPIIAVLPIVVADHDGSVLIDITKVFSDDIETLSAHFEVVRSGLTPTAVNPSRSYITRVRVFPENFGIRTHLTFMAKDPKNANAPLRGVSMRIGHSLVRLPEEPMSARAYDPRVGFFSSAFREYESDGKSVAKSSAVITRFKLEKKDPSAEISDPVQPIKFYIGREVPDRWRPYLKAGVELWLPVFRAAGFSNAIIVADAPSFKDDPNWTEEDARINVIRWLAEPFENAIGPKIYDPRTGEIISAHIQIWPEMLQFFSRYYFAIASSLDPKANSLPFNDELTGQLLQYVVGHEVGHTLGLRHNHLASTAYSVRQMREPNFANKWGANSSIMAYGRFNQAAQPGDGVTKIIPGLGPYDYFAIDWGYGVHGKTSGEEQTALDRLAAKSATNRELLWGAVESPSEGEIWGFDPRHQTENTGADRLEATKLGIANVLRSLKKLDAATRGDNDEFVAAFKIIQSQHVIFLKSVGTLVSGIEVNPHIKSGPTSNTVPFANQQAAVRYLLGEGAQSLDAYKAPEFATRVNTTGELKHVEKLQASIVDMLFEGSQLTLLELQKATDPKAYGLLDFAQDSYDSLWADLSPGPRWHQEMQRAYLLKMAALFKAEHADPTAREAEIRASIGTGFSREFAEIYTATGAETALPAWARGTLPNLALRLDRAGAAAKNINDRLHFRTMATLARRALDQGK